MLKKVSFQCTPGPPLLVAACTHGRGKAPPRVDPFTCTGAVRYLRVHNINPKGPCCCGEISNFWNKTSNKNGGVGMRLTYAWHKWKRWSESLGRTVWSHREFAHFSPLHQSAIENDTNEGPNLYLSPKKCPLCNFSIFKSPDTCLGLSYSILFCPFLYTRRAEERVWSTISKFLASQKLEICLSKFFVPFSCLRPWLIKRIIELGLLFSCSLNHEKSFFKHRITLLWIRWTNYGKGHFWSFL